MNANTAAAERRAKHETRYEEAAANMQPVRIRLLAARTAACAA